MPTPPEPPALAALAALTPRQLTPALLAIARAQAARRRPADLNAQFERDGFVQPSALDARLLHRIDGFALDAAAEFQAMQLSPVAPLGCCSALAPTSQDRTLSAARGTEVVSDPTNVLALACAARLRRQPDEAVRLCAVHQVLRAQPLPPLPGYSRHFRLFVLAEAGPGRADDGFEVDAIARHIAVMDRIFDRCAEIGAGFPDRRAVVLAIDSRRVLADRVSARLASALPHVAVAREPLERSYYAGLRVMFGASTRAGEYCPIGDLGLFDWVARLTANRRHRLVASGLGIQLIPAVF
jgi:hypothetical protein